MNDTITKDALPTSFTAFNPIGHLMLGLPSTEHLEALRAALRANGWPSESLVEFTPREGVEEFAEMIDNAGPLVGFGYEITLMRRYMTLAGEGCGWLVIYAPDEKHTAQVTEVAKRFNAKSAVHYGRLLHEDLI